MAVGREQIVEFTVKMEVFLFLCSLLLMSFGQSHGASHSLKRSSFPPGFIFGTASAAYQFEGAAKEGGRGPSLWDTYTHKYPERIADGSNGDIAIDQYNRYKEDVGIMKNMGLDAYRFSISWSRILPKGKLSGGINKEGIAYYNNLINELLANGLKPFVTIFHWDIPQALEDEYNGFLSPIVRQDFRDFADVCFKEFGDRVKFWITLNEPWTFSKGGYADGTLAPGRCSDWQNRNCTGGNSGTEPYLVTHHQLLSHAVAVKLYREKYQGNQKGMIGTTLVSSWNVPFSNKMKDQKACQIALDFMFGWFMDPLTRGEYPKIMRSYVGKRLPEFTKEESEMLKGSFDFIGLNYYSTSYTSFQPSSNVNASYMSDSHVSLSGVRNGIPIGKQAASKWLYVYPKGLRDLLIYTKIKYNNPLIYITENGVDELNNASLPLKQQLDDKFRIDFHNDHMYYLLTAIRDGVNVKGYFPWSLMDNFEWGDGYTVRFGMNYVDFKDGLKRYPKRSAGWFTKFLKS